MASVFTRIIAGELPAHFVWQDDLCVAFLSINPLRPGHTLVVPRAEIDHWIDLDDETLTALMRVARTIARAQQRAYRPSKVGMLIAGLEVAHAHIHVSPIDDLHDMDFANVGPNPGDMALAAEAARIRAALTR
ncbi:MAG: HIT family protein [Gammaproteobacteria bacterium]|nr:HIT family protein [Gammaproteobacteria bacterium]